MRGASIFWNLAGGGERPGPPGPPFRERWDGPWPSGPGGLWGGPRRGAWGGFGPLGRERRFEKGDVKYVILDLLQEQPRHGYDVIRALEERSRGSYTPSPGSVYPTLQLLEDQGFLASSQQDGKRVYAITDAGRAFLAEQASSVQDARARARPAWGPEVHAELEALGTELHALARVLFPRGAPYPTDAPTTLRALTALVRRAREEAQALRERETPGGARPASPASAASHSSSNPPPERPTHADEVRLV